MSNLRRFCVATGLIPALSGCSLWMVDGPPVLRAGAPPPDEVNCTTTQVAPMIDLGVGASIGVGYIAVLDEGGGDGAASGHILTGTLITGLVGSAIHGFRKVSSCNEFIRELQRRGDFAGSQWLSSSVPTFGTPGSEAISGPSEATLVAPQSSLPTWLPLQTQADDLARKRVPPHGPKGTQQSRR